MKIAVKRLTASDLTFFEPLFRKLKVGNQKAINLNANVFVRELYPALPEYAAEHKNQIPIDLSIWGPKMAPRHPLQRKIIKGGSYKNWRLDGEFVYEPDDAPDRYDTLEAGDIAVLGFSGDFARPDALSLILLSRSAHADGAIAERLNAYLGKEPMLRLHEADLGAILDETKTEVSHPLRALLADPVLEDQLGPQGAERIGYKRPRRKQSREELADRQKAQEEYGRRGEELVNAYLRTNPHVHEVVWKEADEEDATAPYDFSFKDADDHVSHVDVKASGRFDNLLRFSSAELEEIRDCKHAHYVYRVHDLVPDDGAKLRIARVPAEWAAEIMSAKLPDGVALLTVAVAPAALSFDADVIELKDVEIPENGE